MMTLSLEAVIALGGAIASLLLYCAWASLKIGSVNNQVNTNKSEIDRIEIKIDKLNSDLSNNYVHNRVMDEIKQQLNDIKDAINNLKN